MNANAVPLLAVFEKKIQLEVPLFQRQYVWSREQQWEPLWEDIARKFTEYLEDRKDAPVHFLGAMVLDQKKTPTTHVEKRQVIDGQQRLMTLQIFLAAFRDLCHEWGATALADDCTFFTLNKGLMANPETDQFKVWPTQLDRRPFADVMTSSSRKALEELHPLRRKKYARKPEPRPRIVEAYLFFDDQLREFFLGDGTERPTAAERELAARLEECFHALRNALQVVVIDLDQGDDAQVIFETLNARGEPLLPADLVRNFIFLRAARNDEPQEALYKEYWTGFDEEFWRKEVRQGRLKRPRSDLFLQHFLASQQTIDIPIRHLFVEYKFWINKQVPFATVREELATLARYRGHFQRIVDPRPGDAIYALATFLDRFDHRTAYPLLLHLLDSDLTVEEWAEISTILESYLLRRAICGLTTKNYNRVFLTLTRALRKDGTSVESIRRHLSDLRGDSTEWPSDDRFWQAWQTRHIYQTLQSPRIVHIFRRLNDVAHTRKTEDVVINGPLSVEHILPQDWIANWPLSDGSRGLSREELHASDPEDPRARATVARNAILQTLGNLTVVTQPLNSAASNSAWPVKKKELESSVLVINQELREFETWDEAAIAKRSRILFDRALQLWPGPDSDT